MKKTFLAALAILAITASAQAEIKSIDIAPGEKLTVTGVDGTWSDYFGTGTALSSTTAKSFRPCGKDDLKKALRLANKYLPARQEAETTSVLYLDNSAYYSIAPREKESEKLRRKADELDKKDRDLQFIEDVLNDKCD